MLPPSLHCHSLLPDLSFYTECRISLWLGTGFCCERVSFHSGYIVLFHVSHPSLCFALTMSTVQGFSCLKWFLRRSCCFLTSSLWRIRITAFSKHEPPTPLPHPPTPGMTRNTCSYFTPHCHLYTPAPDLVFSFTYI